MWKRKDLKDKAKVALKNNYWKSVLVAAIFTAIVGANAGSGAGTTSSQLTPSEMTDMAGLEPVVVVTVLVVLLLFIVGAIIVNAFLLSPLVVGIDQFKINAIRNNANLSDLGRGFDTSYKRNVKTLFLMDLYTVLWFCLFIIPGIVKSYEYRMIPYILADDPDISCKEAFAKSKAMMNGNKWNTFVLDLSFILWNMLGAITGGLVSLFYVEPYKHLTSAALYEELKTK